MSLKTVRGGGGYAPRHCSRSLGATLRPLSQGSQVGQVVHAGAQMWSCSGLWCREPGTTLTVLRWGSSPGPHLAALRYCGARVWTQAHRVPLTSNLAPQLPSDALCAICSLIMIVMIWRAPVAVHTTIGMLFPVFIPLASHVSKSSGLSVS